jgi:hypothetical protein
LPSNNPDKLYIGTFERTARFNAHLDEAGILSACIVPAPTTRANPCACTSIMLYALFAEILHELAKTAASLPAGDLAHREALCDAARAFYLALEADKHKSDDPDDLTPEEEVRLLHILE